MEADSHRLDDAVRFENPGQLLRLFGDAGTKSADLWRRSTRCGETSDGTWHDFKR
jgi:hypothetical protein